MAVIDNLDHVAIGDAQEVVVNKIIHLSRDNVLVYYIGIIYQRYNLYNHMIGKLDN
jgi:hypothetical protein